MIASDITFFDRHASMDTETLSLIKEISFELCVNIESKTFRLQNWISGALDGYDYSDIALKSQELFDVFHEDSVLANKIRNLFETIATYTRI